MHRVDRTRLTGPVEDVWCMGPASAAGVDGYIETFDAGPWSEIRDHEVHSIRGTREDIEVAGPTSVASMEGPEVMYA